MGGTDGNSAQSGAQARRNMKKLVLIAAALGLGACATTPADTHFLWQGKAGEALRHFGSADAAQAALERDVAVCSFEIRQTAAGEFSEEPGLSRNCMAEKGWIAER
jgi:hypothetical protein